MFTIDNGTLERIFKLAGTTVFSHGDGIFPMDKERIISSLSCKGTKCNERYPSIECVDSISRTVTCTGELSALTCVIPRGGGFHTPPSR